jgi:hypothetical protein
VFDLLKADREPLSYEELIQLQAEPAFDEETEPVVSKQLTSKNLSKAFSLRTILTSNVALKFLEELTQPLAVINH